nr:zinc finger CCCH domain-containing protein 14 [Tanacetum cinerariifolium]
NKTSVVVDVMNGNELKEFRKMKMTWKKTTLCHKWMASGSCPYGTHCLYAHGVSEMRKGSREWLVKTCKEKWMGNDGNLCARIEARLVVFMLIGSMIHRLTCSFTTE